MIKQCLSVSARTTSFANCSAWYEEICVTVTACTSIPVATVHCVMAGRADILLGDEVLEGGDEGCVLGSRSAV